MRGYMKHNEQKQQQQKLLEITRGGGLQTKKPVRLFKIKIIIKSEIQWINYITDWKIFSIN